MIYDGSRVDAGYRIDLLIDGAIIVEVKTIDTHTPIYQAQLLTYLKLSDCRVGLLMSFHIALFKQGLKRLGR
jgi:GxxExxY protein